MQVHLGSIARRFALRAMEVVVPFGNRKTFNAVVTILLVINWEQEMPRRMLVWHQAKSVLIIWVIILNSTST